MGKEKYKRMTERLDEEMTKLDHKITAQNGMCPSDLKMMYWIAKTTVKVAKMEDIMCHYWETKRLSGHPHEDGHYEHYGHKEKTPAPGTMPR